MEGGFGTEYEQDLLAECKNLTELDIHRWVGMVQWFDGMPFGVAGDSGALVHAVDNSVKIPLRLHIGSPPESILENTSMFLCLDAYFLEARLLGLRLEFASEEDEESGESEADI
ncbi:hypothetical protein J4E89_010065 [Alternaria sp. Ai002NY15]|nr:hypothetical protein J4E89_010065 [Alternaria sp. Ai002NY15]